MKNKNILIIGGTGALGKSLIEKYYDAREGFYRKLKDYEIYGRGWSRRNKETFEISKDLIDL